MANFSSGSDPFVEEAHSNSVSKEMLGVGSHQLGTRVSLRMKSMWTIALEKADTVFSDEKVLSAVSDIQKHPAVRGTSFSMGFVSQALSDFVLRPLVFEPVRLVVKYPLSSFAKSQVAESVIRKVHMLATNDHAYAVKSIRSEIFQQMDPGAPDSAISELPVRAKQPMEANIRNWILYPTLWRFSKIRTAGAALGGKLLNLVSSNSEQALTVKKIRANFPRFTIPEFTSYLKASFIEDFMAEYLEAKEDGKNFKEHASEILKTQLKNDTEMDTLLGVKTQKKLVSMESLEFSEAKIEKGIPQLTYILECTDNKVQNVSEKKPEPIKEEDESELSQEQRELNEQLKKQKQEQHKERLKIGTKGKDNVEYEVFKMVVSFHEDKWLVHTLDSIERRDLLI